MKDQFEQIMKDRIELTKADEALILYYRNMGHGELRDIIIRDGRPVKAHEALKTIKFDTETQKH